MPEEPTFGRLVRHLRLTRGWTQRQLAERANLALATISNVELETTHRLVSQTVDALAAAFGISPEQLDPRRLGEAVAEHARSIAKRAVIEEILRLPDAEMEEVLRLAEAIKARHRARAARAKKKGRGE
jgi:transcriptional regulator with XRE-family HTH domain